MMSDSLDTKVKLAYYSMTIEYLAYGDE